MKPEKLFEEALGLRSPWRVEEGLFSPEEWWRYKNLGALSVLARNRPSRRARKGRKARMTQVSSAWAGVKAKDLGALGDLGERPFFASTLARHNCCLGSPTLD